MRRGRFTHRDDLVGEHPLGDAVQLILLVIFLIIWIGDSYFVKISTGMAHHAPLSLRIVLFVIGITMAGYLSYKGLAIVFGEEREPPSVIRKSVFGLVRHPIYLGSIVVYFSCVVLTFSILSLLLWFLIVTFYVYLSRYEERLLLKRFGSEYRDYMHNVPMLFPWPRRKNI